MMQEEYECQFVPPMKEVNLACLHEYCAMVTACLNGCIGEQDYMMLVDSGSELNIMMLHQVQELALPIDDSGNSWMLKGISGHTMGLKGICWNVPVKIGRIEFPHTSLFVKLIWETRTWFWASLGYFPILPGLITSMIWECLYVYGFWRMVTGKVALFLLT